MSDDSVPSSAAPAPPPGWYPDPDGPGQPRWWDGKGWRMPSAHRDLDAGAGALGVGTAILIGFCGLLSVATVVLYVWGVSAVADDIEAGVPGTPSTFDRLETGSGIVGVALTILTAVLWCIWQYRLAAAVAPGRLRRGAGMHAGSWFIPVVFWWFPLQNMRDLWQVYLPRGDTRLLGWWWALWLGGILLGRLQATTNVRTVDDFRTYAFLGVLQESVGVLAAVLAAVLVVRLTRAAMSR